MADFVNRGRSKLVGQSDNYALRREDSRRVNVSGWATLKRGGWSPSLTEQVQALFANGEQGALYYLTEDFAGLYQDSFGITPVTAVGQPVGLMLDRRFGLVRGAEATTNGNFVTDSGWFKNGPGVSWADGRYTVADVGGTDSYISQQLTGIKAGALLRVAINVVFTNATAAGTRLRQGSVVGQANYGDMLDFGHPVGATGILSFVITAGGDNPWITLLTATTNTHITYNSISVREIPGNHARQPTTTARPTLRSGPLRIDYDGVDDYLRTVFPALGSDVTIARSIPGTGAQYLTGQTIAAGNWDDNVTSCATLVIDRALTPSEQTLVTEFLNQQAGV